MNSTYLSYEEYTAYGGSISVSEFPAAELRARKHIDQLTSSRVADMAEVPEAVKICMVQIIGAKQRYGLDILAESPLVSSFTTDGYSESYGSADEQLRAARSEVNNTIRELLYGETDDRGVPLLYRGVVEYAAGQ